MRIQGPGGEPGTDPGTYVLVLELREEESLEIGGLGEHRFRPGRYLYVGSAFGPGGVAGRLRHHVRRTSRPHWHIDYLRARARLSEVWFRHDVAPREHDWAAALGGVPGASEPVEGFGASDCGCSSHLLRISGADGDGPIRRALVAERGDAAPIRVWRPEAGPGGGRR